MNKLTALIEAANRKKHNMIGPVSMVVSAETILELCALLTQAEEALKGVWLNLGRSDTYRNSLITPALAAIKQWREKE